MLYIARNQYPGMKSNMTSSFLSFFIGRKFLLFIILVFSCCYVKAQVANYGNMYIAGNMYVNATFTNYDTANYQNDGNLYLTGNFVNNQPFMAEGTGNTRFSGSSLQKIGGTQAPDFHNVIFSNASGVQMKVNVIIGGLISTINGSLYFNDYALAMGGKINTVYTNTSAFNVTNLSDLILYGDAASGNKIYFDPAANTLHDLTVNTGATGTLGNALNITSGSSFGTVTANGNFDAAGYLTLRSDANGTARVANSSGTISNYATVERYVPGRRSWRFMAVPINNDTLTIRSAWQEGANNHDLVYANHQDPHPGFGTDITGDNDYTKGFDVNTTYNPSIKTWIQSTASFSTSAPPTISTLLNAYPAYCLFVRGSRAVDLSLAVGAPTSNTIIRETGRLNNGTYTKNYTGNVGDYLFVGNPYASSIDLADVLPASAGVATNKFYVWDPAINGSYGVGGYVTYDNGIMVPATPNYPVATTIIQGEQAFIVQSTATSTSMNFTQSSKSGSEKNVFKPVRNEYPHVYVNLLTPSQDSLLLIDGVGAIFDNKFSTLIDDDDAVKAPNYNENIALIRFNRKMAVEARPLPVLTDTLFFKITNVYADQPYVLSMLPENESSENLQAYLIDKYLSKQTPLPASDTTLYSFTPTSDTATYMRRFMIVYNMKKIATPVQTALLNNVAATKLNTLSIYPNPVTDGSFKISLMNMMKDDYTIDVYDNSGKILFTKKINHPGGSNSYSVKLDNRMAAGLYTVYVTNSDRKSVQKTTLIISKK